MALLAIPNVSEGRSGSRVDELLEVVRAAGLRVLDVHSDPIHNRSVFTLHGEGPSLVTGLAALAESASRIDLRGHVGVHPRLGVLDVCPIVPHGEPMDAAVSVAHAAGKAIGDKGLPVYFYGYAAMRPQTRELPDLRRGGLPALMKRAGSDLPPDAGPREIGPARGVVCVGARDVLIAFNVWVKSGIVPAAAIAARVRARNGGPPGVRALGLQIRPGIAQVSMNLTRPDEAGIDTVFNRIATLCSAEGIEITATEIVGLVPERYMPTPDAPAARLLMGPGRSVESAL